MSSLVERLRNRDAIAERNPSKAIVLCEEAADRIAELEAALAAARAAAREQCANLAENEAAYWANNPEHAGKVEAADNIAAAIRAAS